MLCGDLKGKEVQKRVDIYIYIYLLLTAVAGKDS